MGGRVIVVCLCLFAGGVLVMLLVSAFDHFSGRTVVSDIVLLSAFGVVLVSLAVGIGTAVSWWQNRPQLPSVPRKWNLTVSMLEGELLVTDGPAWSRGVYRFPVAAGTYSLSMQGEVAGTANCVHNVLLKRCGERCGVTAPEWLFEVVVDSGLILLPIVRQRGGLPDPSATQALMKQFIQNWGQGFVEIPGESGTWGGMIFAPPNGDGAFPMRVMQDEAGIVELQIVVLWPDSVADDPGDT